MKSSRVNIILSGGISGMKAGNLILIRNNMFLNPDNS
jgi:hypothetical protein